MHKRAGPSERVGIRLAVARAANQDTFLPELPCFSRMELIEEAGCERMTNVRTEKKKSKVKKRKEKRWKIGRD